MLKHLNRKEVKKEYRSMVRKVEMFREKRKNPSQNKIASTIIQVHRDATSNQSVDSSCNRVQENLLGRTIEQSSRLLKKTVINNSNLPFQ